MEIDFLKGQTEKNAKKKSPKKNCSILFRFASRPYQLVCTSEFVQQTTRTNSIRFKILTKHSFFLFLPSFGSALENFIII